MLGELAPKDQDLKQTIDMCGDKIEAKLLLFKQSGNGLFAQKKLRDAIDQFSKGAQYYAR